MEDEDENIIIRFIFTVDVEVVPADATHVTVHESVKVIPARAFYEHQNIEEFECHDGVEKVEEYAFSHCPFLRRVKMPGVKIVEREAFSGCGESLADVECDKLERIGYYAFGGCSSLRSINLPSVKIVEEDAFSECEALTDVTFGDKLERIKGRAFYDCESLERIAIPLSSRIIDDDDDDDYYYGDVFPGCENLKHVDLVGGVHETIAALPVDEWRNDMNAAIDAINQILPNTPAGSCDEENDDDDEGEEGRAVKRWIISVLRKIVDYKQQHYNMLTKATTTLVEELALLPQDIAINNVLPFLELPSFTFEVEELGKLVLLLLLHMFGGCAFVEISY
jgi:hypothetical protein